MEDLARAALLGTVQALTELLPISSSGHLILAPRLVGQGPSSLTFDVALHLGTAVAVLGYFWRDWYRIGVAGLGDVRRHGIDIRSWGSDSLLGLWIAVATIPAVMVGLALGRLVEEELRDPAVVAAALIIVGVVIGVLDRWGTSASGLHDMRGRRAIVIGLAQALALVPGVSRSGITIAAARGLGFERGEAARLSFLLSGPLVAGAGVFQVGGALRSGESLEWAPVLLGALVAAFLGALVIRFLLRFVQSRTLMPFVWYRLGLGGGVFGALAVGWI